VSGLSEAFALHGFAVTAPLLSEREAVALREGVGRVFDRCSASMGLEPWLARVSQVRSPELWDEAFVDLGAHAGLRAAVHEVLGAEGRVAWQHLVWRPPHCPIRLPWHADRPTWPEELRASGGVAVWLALDASGPDSGGLRYGPGSHRPDHEPQASVCPEVPVGAALLHHPDVLHQSGENLTGDWRRALILVFTPR